MAVHIDPDFPTKKAFKEAFKKGIEIFTYTPGGLFQSQNDGRVTVEAPAIFHRWYSSVEIKDRKIVKIYG